MSLHPNLDFTLTKQFSTQSEKDGYMTLHDVVGVDKNEKLNRKNVVGCREHSKEKRRTRIDFLCNDMQTAEPSTSWAEGGGAFPQILAGIQAKYPRTKGIGTPFPAPSRIFRPSCSPDMKS